MLGISSHSGSFGYYFSVSTGNVCRVVMALAVIISPIALGILTQSAALGYLWCGIEFTAIYLIRSETPVPRAADVLVRPPADAAGTAATAAIVAATAAATAAAIGRVDTAASPVLGGVGKHGGKKKQSSDARRDSPPAADSAHSDARTARAKRAALVIGPRPRSRSRGDETSPSAKQNHAAAAAPALNIDNPGEGSDDETVVRPVSSSSDTTSSSAPFSSPTTTTRRRARSREGRTERVAKARELQGQGKSPNSASNIATGVNVSKVKSAVAAKVNAFHSTTASGATPASTSTTAAVANAAIGKGSPRQLGSHQETSQIKESKGHHRRSQTATVSAATVIAAATTVKSALRKPNKPSSAGGVRTVGPDNNTLKEKISIKTRAELKAELKAIELEEREKAAAARVAAQSNVATQTAPTNTTPDGDA